MVADVRKRGRNMQEVALRPAIPEDSDFAFGVKKAALGEYLREMGGWDEEEQRRLHERRFCPSETRIILSQGQEVGLIRLREGEERIHLRPVAAAPPAVELFGDALLEVLRPSLLNYSILGNTDRALHVHIHPRYEEEEFEKRRTHPIIYHWLKMPPIPFDLERDRPLMQQLRTAISKRTEVG
jgi:hypothetical protein